MGGVEIANELNHSFLQFKYTYKIKLVIAHNAVHNKAIASLKSAKQLAEESSPTLLSELSAFTSALSVPIIILTLYPKYGIFYDFFSKLIRLLTIGV
ncbi:MULTISPECIES: hypothetical protein [Paenibacillus]|uniref:hypothetical protein n=1 Tax=Paenibacillus TaxID=44249 RepID=UPI0013E3663E|nr:MULTISPECIES: hypothetical protein [Paenibacillus]MCY9659898.1 hypothetical protein [Paenibacillus anseongense]